MVNSVHGTSAKPSKRCSMKLVKKVGYLVYGNLDIRSPMKRIRIVDGALVELLHQDQYPPLASCAKSDMLGYMEGFHTMWESCWPSRRRPESISRPQELLYERDGYGSPPPPADSYRIRASISGPHSPTEAFCMRINTGGPSRASSTAWTTSRSCPCTATHFSQRGLWWPQT